MLIMFAFNHCLLNNLYIYIHIQFYYYISIILNSETTFMHILEIISIPQQFHQVQIMSNQYYTYIYKPTLSRCGSTPRTRMIRLVEPPAQHDDITPTPRLREMKTGLEGWDIKLGLHRQVCELNIP